MVQDIKHNAHNEGITPRPRIFVSVEVKDSFVREIVGLTHRLREFTSAFFELGSKENKELEASVTEEDRAAFKALLALRCAYSADEPIGKNQLAEATRLLIPHYPGDAAEYARVTDAKKVAHRIYPALLRDRIKRARVIILPDFSPAIFCPSLSVAMFVYAAYRGVAVCLNCQKLFAYDSERPDGGASEKYCTAACGQRYRQKLYRLRISDRAKQRKNKKRGRK
jgi:hypothetical protein